MVYQENYDDYGKGLAYDLRQIYARIVGEHLQDISIARKELNYYNYYKALEDLHTIIKHKFKKESDEKEYQRLLKLVITLANKYKTIWLTNAGRSNDGAEVEAALRDIEMFLYSKMNDAKMFGAEYNIQGL